MTTTIAHAAEIYTSEGPTGEHVEVLIGQVQDYGGNVLFQGDADSCVAEAHKCRLPTRLVPTAWRMVEGEVAGADHTWQCIVID